MNNIQSPLDDQSQAIQLQIILSGAFHFLGRWAVALLAKGFGVKMRQLVASQLHRDPANAVTQPIPSTLRSSESFSVPVRLSPAVAGFRLPAPLQPLSRSQKRRASLSAFSIFFPPALSTSSPFSPSLVTPLPSSLYAWEGERGEHMSPSSKRRSVGWKELVVQFSCSPGGL